MAGLTTRSVDHNGPEQNSHSQTHSIAETRGFPVPAARRHAGQTGANDRNVLGVTPEGGKELARASPYCFISATWDWAYFAAP